MFAEVERRISAHLSKKHATRPNTPLDEEKKYWNDLVLTPCLFFTLSHRGSCPVLNLHP